MQSPPGSVDSRPSVSRDSVAAYHELQLSLQHLDGLARIVVYVRRRSAFGRGHLLHEEVSSAGIFAFQLHRNQVANQPNRFPLARGNVSAVILGIRPRISLHSRRLALRRNYDAQ
jgi:hypothetical protein